MGLENIKSYMIGIVIFIVMISGGVILFSGFLESDPALDPANDLSSFNSTLNKANNIQDSVTEIDNSIKDVSEENTGLLGWLNVLVGSAFKGLKVIGQSVGFFTTSMSEIAAFFGVPSILVTLLVLIVTIIIIFAIWAAIMKV